MKRLLLALCYVLVVQSVEADLYPPSSVSSTADTSGTPSVETEMYASLSCGGIASGVWSYPGGTLNHPGIYRNTSASGANSGGFCLAAVNNSFLISGGEKGILIFRIPNSDDLVAWMGFEDGAGAAGPTDGVYLALSGTTLSGVAKAGGAPTATGTTYTISTGTWYRGTIQVNSNATVATFGLYSDSGALLWTDSVTSGLPTTVGQETGFGVGIIKTTISARALIDVDYIRATFDRPLIR